MVVPKHIFGVEFGRIVSEWVLIFSVGGGVLSEFALEFN
jgi:hypothetical protein